MAAFVRSIPSDFEGVCPTFVRIFADDRKYCCDSKIRLSPLEATFDGRDECYPTKHSVKQCTGGCAAAYYLNKMTFKGETGAEDVTWHCFYTVEGVNSRTRCEEDSGKKGEGGGILARRWRNGCDVQSVLLFEQWNNVIRTRHKPHECPA